MPNWIQNRLTINGPEPDIDRFVTSAGTKPETKIEKDNINRLLTVGRIKKATRKDDREWRTEILWFENLVPIPTKFPTKYNKQKEDERAYNWRLDNWGTKWSAYDAYAKRIYRTRIRYEFDTAWNAPLTWVKAVAKQYPNLQFFLKVTEVDEPTWEFLFEGHDFYVREDDVYVQKRLIG